MADDVQRYKDSQIAHGLDIARQLKGRTIQIREALVEDKDVIDEVQQGIDENLEAVKAEAKELTQTLRDVVAGNKCRKMIFGYILLTYLVVGALTRFT